MIKTRNWCWAVERHACRCSEESEAQLSSINDQSKVANQSPNPAEASEKKIGLYNYIYTRIHAACL